MDKSSPARVSIHHHRNNHAVLASSLVTALIMASLPSMAIGQGSDRKDSQDSTHASHSLNIDGSFSSLYEPSGIAPLPDGRFLIVEDEPDRALRLVTARMSTTGDTLALEDETYLAPPASLTERLSVGVLDDLEGTAHDQSGRLYVVSSHDDAAPHWSSQRQKLLRFSIQDGRMQDVSRVLTLRRDLLAHFPQLEDNTSGKKKPDPMNIEALAYDRRRHVLLIGFRSPVIDGQALIIRVKNPDAYLSGDAPAELEAAPWSVDLDKGGLRAMSYDEQSDQLLLVSRRENHKNDAYKLWRLPADGQEQAVRIEIGKQEDSLESVEGLAPISLESSRGSDLLLVRDNGNAKKAKGADWFVLSRSQLGLELGLQ